MNYSENRSDYVSWGFTVKDNREDSTDYVQFFDRCQEFGCIVTKKYYEFDSLKKLHYHGVIMIPKGFYRKKLMLKGLHLCLEEIWNEAGWLKYAQKDQGDEECIVQTKEPATPDGCTALLRKLKGKLWIKKPVYKNYGEYMSPPDTPISVGDVMDNMVTQSEGGQGKQSDRRTSRST